MNFNSTSNSELIGLIFSVLVFQLSLLKGLAMVQQKDYFWGRIWAEKKILLPQGFGLILIAVALAILSPLNYEIKPLIVSATLGSYFGVKVVEVATKKLQRPKITLRIILMGTTANILIGIIIIVGFKIGLGLEWASALLIFSAAWSVLICAISNQISRHIVYIEHRRSLSRASRRLNAIPDLQVIGIAGSYGKSTTKEFLNTILREEFKVISTPGSINSDIGLANSLNDQIAKLGGETQNLERAVIETDGFTQGTIARIMSYFPIDIALITNINEQHLETFGGKMENLLAGNYELIQGLKSEGPRLAIFNSADDHSLELAKQYHSELEASGVNPDEYIYYFGDGGSSDETKRKSDCWPSEIESVVTPGEHKIKFQLKFSQRLGGETTELELPIPAEFNAYNYAAAALTARLAGVDLNAIKRAASKVSIKKGTLNLSYSNQTNIELIDDSFNANPAGVRGLLELIEQRDQVLPAENILLFGGLYDLGPKTETVYRELSELILKSPTNLQVLVSKTRFKTSLANTELHADHDEYLKHLKDKIALAQRDSKLVRIVISNRIPVKVMKYVRAQV